MTADIVSKEIGQSVVIENRPGAAGSLALEILAWSGYTRLHAELRARGEVVVALPGPGETADVRRALPGATVLPESDVGTFAGAGVEGSTDGAGGAVRFRFPSGVAVDGAGNVYVADTRKQTIRRITPSGEVSTLAGTAGQPGSVDGLGSAARFDGPSGVATDSVGNVYVADSINNTIRKINPAGEVSTLAGTAGQRGSADGISASARFSGPYGLAADSAGNLYVADEYNFTIRKVSPAGEVTTLAGTPGQAGSADATGAAARFDLPDAFANAPVINPDGSLGINLHITSGQAIDETESTRELGTLIYDCSYNWTAFENLKLSHFPRERWPIFHYMIFAHDLPNFPCISGRPSGISRNGNDGFYGGASDFIVALGDWEAFAEFISDTRAGTFMQELGHNLGLGHGGIILDDHGNVIDSEHTLFKPNHLSVMNYSFQTRGIRMRGGLFGLYQYGHFDYS